ncbi:N-acetylmuramic acid 6-phosphate etherase [Salisediminibacterium beveridgei]|uniref:N-acetylmuramic acid 6-phosphate etherase n=1 Tax=Salisediminibacterium beveridgei TaxID=632773 RepID=A0A1D7QZR0_9BACI|nr:N-acetylmuramic acid 6-phosphate etherase [Salisediminibacterium beveridgei]AOM84492.1 N-acetylmuramic acid 6-phosphate etherase [Salisediminibacterium beveridgei]
MEKLDKLLTELRNESSMNIDQESTSNILTIINEEDRTVADSVKKTLPAVEKAVDEVVQALKNGGKLFYVGAGTSGRIGILDAVECPPTFSVPSDLVQAVVAGGDSAIATAVEGAEDDEQLAAKELASRGVTELDVVIGIAASGSTPYVAGALQYAEEVGAKTVSLSSNKDSLISQYASINIEVVTGPEVLTGSTRMKAASAHKMILNMITTTTMIKIGKVYENLMVDVKVSNNKLKERAINIVSTITKVSYADAEDVLRKTDYEVKPAIVMIKADIGFASAQEYIKQTDGFIREAIQLAHK